MQYLRVAIVLSLAGMAAAQLSPKVPGWVGGIYGVFVFIAWGLMEELKDLRKAVAKLGEGK